LTGPSSFEKQYQSSLAACAYAAVYCVIKMNILLLSKLGKDLPQMRNQSPISATNASNIAYNLVKGIIDGNGDVWRAVKIR
jgi:hypothetical protein